MTELESSIIKLRKENLSVGRIADELGCSRGTVSYHINNHNLGGVMVKKHIQSDEDFINNIPKDIRQKIISLREGKKTYNEILGVVSISKDKLKKICRIYGLNGHVARNNKIIDDSLIKTMREFYLKLFSYQKVADKLGVSKKTVAKHCKDLVKNKPKSNRKKKIVEYVSNFRKRRKLDLVVYKGGKCERCGYDKSIRSLQFHHLNPNNKDFTISGRNYSLDRMKKEVDKCILVCSNCHGEIHDEIDGSYC